MKNYSIKNIIFGLRGEYLNFQRQIDALKQFIICDENYDLYATKNYDYDKFDLVCSFSTVEKKKHSDKVKMVAGIIYEGNSKTVSENSIIKIPDKEALIKRMDELDETSFGQEMLICEPEEIKSDYCGVKDLILWSNLIEYRIMDRNLSLKRSVFYSPYEDTVFFETSEWFKKADEKFIREMLSEEVPEYVFRRYHKEIMDEYIRDNRTMVIKNSKDDTKCTAYSIKQDDKVLLLKR